jgi:hypothetical protein
MSNKGIRFGAMALVSAAILGSGGASAFAASPSSTAASASAPSNTLSEIQAKAAAAITLRVNDLNAAIAKVNAAKDLGSGATTLDQYLGVDIAPLQALGQTISSDQTVTTAEADYADIFTDYRVLALVLPAAQLAATSDSIDNGAVPDLTAFSAKAATHVNAATEATLDPLISNLNGEIAVASTSTIGLASVVLGYVPSQWNANRDLLSSARSSVSTARGDVNQATSDVRQIRAYVKASHPAVTPGSTTTTSS